MKSNSLLVLNIILMLFIQKTQAAIPTQNFSTSKNLNHLVGILSLPEANRLSALHGLPKDQTYSDLKKISFSDEFSMGTRWQGLIAMSEIGGREALDDLSRAYVSKDWYMRNAALIAVKNINNEVSERWALSLMKDRALVVRSAAVKVISESSLAKHRKLFWQELQASYNFKQQQSLWIRYEILQSLAKNPLDEERKEFVHILKTDTDLEIQRIACLGLEKLTGLKLGNEGSTNSEVIQLWKEKIKDSLF